jgi:glucokinase
MALIGIDIGGTNIRVGLVEDEIVTELHSITISKNWTADEVTINLVSLLRKLSFEKVDGIGVGVPSVVDVEKGIVYDVQNIPAWKEVHLKKNLEEIFKVPVYVNNDANCFAVGEKYFGKAKNYADVVGLIVGTGMGAGLILNNKLYSGNNCGAGEFGMIPYQDSIFEKYCSGQFFENYFKISGNRLFEMAENGDSHAFEIFDEFGSNLGDAVKMIMYAVDPQIIVLGGSVSKSYKYFQESMWNSVKGFAYGRSADKIKIEVSEINNIAILGAAALFLDAVSNKS